MKEKENINIFELKFVTPDQEKLIKGAVDLVNNFSNQGFMLPVTLKDYTVLASKGVLVVAQNVNGEIIGTASYSQMYKKNIWEFGGWAVSLEYQHAGVGMKLMKELFSKKPHFQAIAFGNKNSGPIFESLGAKIITDYSVMPEEIFIPCAICPNKPVSGCCDTIYNLEPVVAKLGMPDTSGMTIRQLDRLVWGLGENQSNWFKGFNKDPKDWS